MDIKDAAKTLFLQGASLQFREEGRCVDYTYYKFKKEKQINKLIYEGLSHNLTSEDQLDLEDCLTEISSHVAKHSKNIEKPVSSKRET